MFSFLIATSHLKVFYKCHLMHLKTYKHCVALPSHLQSSPEPPLLLEEFPHRPELRRQLDFQLKQIFYFICKIHHLLIFNIHLEMERKALLLKS